MWVVGALNKEITVSDNHHRIERVPVKWADGMIGVLPVFDSLAAAEKYNAFAMKNPTQIFEIESYRPKVQRPRLRLVQTHPAQK